MPDLKRAGPGEDRQTGGGAAHEEDDANQGLSPVEPFRERSEKGAEQTHRQQPQQHDHHRDQKRRAGALIDDDADRDRFQPPHGEDDKAHEPEAPEIRLARADHPPERRVGHADVSSRAEVAEREAYMPEALPKSPPRAVALGTIQFGGCGEFNCRPARANAIRSSISPLLR